MQCVELNVIHLTSDDLNQVTDMNRGVHDANRQVAAVIDDVEEAVNRRLGRTERMSRSDVVVDGEDSGMAPCGGGRFGWRFDHAFHPPTAVGRRIAWQGAGYDLLHSEPDLLKLLENAPYVGVEPAWRASCGTHELLELDDRESCRGPLPLGGAVVFNRHDAIPTSVHWDLLSGSEDLNAEK